jgi:hypothetical protein
VEGVIYITREVELTRGGNREEGPRNEFLKINLIEN